MIDRNRFPDRCPQTSASSRGKRGVDWVGFVTLDDLVAWEGEELQGFRPEADANAAMERRWNAWSEESQVTEDSRQQHRRRRQGFVSAFSTEVSGPGDDGKTPLPQAHPVRDIVVGKRRSGRKAKIDANEMDIDGSVFSGNAIRGLIADWLGPFVVDALTERAIVEAERKD